MVRIAAVGDIHSPKGLPEFVRLMRRLRGVKVDVFVLAGDIIYKGKVEGARPVFSVIREVLNGVPVISVFGNEEYDEVKGDLKGLSSDVVWLDDELVSLNVGGVSVGFVGSRGCLDEPTPWQARNIPGIRRVYAERIKKIEDLLSRAKNESSMVVLVTHYPPTYLTLKGEPRRFWAQMACSSIESVIRRVKPNLVIHAHAHNSRVPEARLGPVRIVNVSLPARGEIVVLKVERVGLERFLFKNDVI